MKKTLYVSDLDGTLLNSQSQISSTTKTMLNRLVEEEGINFTIATARTPATVVRLLEGVDCQLPLIVMTGAAMWKGGIVDEHYLQASEVESLSALCRKYGVRPFFYTYNGKIIETYHLPETDDYERQFVEQRQHSPFKRFVFQERFPSEKASRTMLIFAAADYDRMGKVYNEASRVLKCSMTYYRDIFNPRIGFLEVMAQGVSKARAAKKLADKIGATRLVVFGDSPNDLSMREVADVFIAPSNASQEVRHVADEVAAGNDDDCVVRWIAEDLRWGKQ